MYSERDSKSGPVYGARDSCVVTTDINIYHFVAHASHDVFGWAFNANLGIGFIAAALTIGCVVEMSRTVGLPWPGSPSPDHVFWVCETFGLSSIFLSAPLLHVAALSSKNVIPGRLDAKQARRALV